MPSYSRTKGAIVAKDGFYVGSKGTETVVVNSAGNVVYGVGFPAAVSFANASTAQTLYTIAPVNGTVTAVYVCSDAAAQAAGYTIYHGSAGDVLASVTATSGSAGTVSTMTLGTVAVTAGESLACVRAACGTTGSSVVMINIKQTS